VMESRGDRAGGRHDEEAEEDGGPPVGSAEEAPGGTSSGMLGDHPEVSGKSKRDLAARTSAFMDAAMPSVGEVPFTTFMVYSMILFAFTAFTDTILVTVAVRATRNKHFDFSMWVMVLNGIWIFFQIVLFADLFYVFFRYYRPRPKDDDKPKIGESRVRMPKTWYCLMHFLQADMNPRSYLLMLSLLLPLNALMFYNGLGSPVYTPSRLEEAGYYNITELVEPAQWPTGSGLRVDVSTWEVFTWNGTAAQEFTPTFFITSRECYTATSPEYRLLGLLRVKGGGEAENHPKQAYCEALIGTMMAGSFEEPASVNEVLGSKMKTSGMRRSSLHCDCSAL